MEVEVQVPNSHLSQDQRLRFRVWLQKKFSERCEKNHRYSLRAFANHIALEASSVSQILSGKRSPSKKSCIKICERLSATPKELKLLGLYNNTSKVDENDFLVSMDVFSFIADWYHYAILELTYVKGFRSDSKWIADHLGISVLEARSAVERLIRLKFLSNEKGKLKRIDGTITNHVGINTSLAKKSHQKQVVGKALTAIDTVPQEEKDITSITMAIDPKNLDKAREVIKDFRRNLCLILEDGSQARVYNLAIQLYPISKKMESK